MTTILLVRHGQTDWNREERFRGRTYISLNENGLQQAEAVGKRIAENWRPAAVFSSPLSRTMQTAERIAAHLGLSVTHCPGIIDIDYGEWQGLSPEQARNRWQKEVTDWFETPHTVRSPGGEPLDHVRIRAMETINDICRQFQNQTVVLVSHTVVNRLILLGILGLGNDRFWRLRQEPGAINVIEAEGGNFTLVTMNDTSHLS